MEYSYGIDVVKRPKPTRLWSPGKTLRTKTADVKAKSIHGLAKHNIEAGIYDGVTPDPTFTVVAEAQKACGDAGVIVAVAAVPLS